MSSAIRTSPIDASFQVLIFTVLFVPVDIAQLVNKIRSTTIKALTDYVYFHGD